MSIEARRANAIRVLNLGTWLSGDEIVCKACKERLSLCQCRASGEVENSIRELDESLIRLASRRERSKHLKQDHAHTGGGVVDADALGRKVLGHCWALLILDDGSSYRFDGSEWSPATPVTEGEGR